MKAKMKVRYNKQIFLAIASFVICAILFAVAYISGKSEIWALACFVCLFTSAALWFHFNYGIKIGKKYVFVMSYGSIKLLKYDEIRYIEVTFQNGCISAKIKETDGSVHSFDWDDILLSSSFPRWNRIIITKKIVKKSIANLSLCDKVRIINHFDG